MRDDPYDEPVLYDLEYADHDEDVAYYRDLARRVGGPVLDLGCGTGRLTLPIANDGTQIVAVDRSEPMLKALRKKVKKRHRMQVVFGDFNALPPLEGAPFSLVMWPFNALHHCTTLEVVERSLVQYRALMEPGSVLALDAYLFDQELYDRDPDERFEPRTFIDPRGGTLQSWEQSWWDAATQIHHVVYTYAKPDGTENRSHLRLHMYPLHGLQAAVRKAGFRFTGQWEDFAGRSLTSGSLKWVAQAVAI